MVLRKKEIKNYDDHDPLRSHHIKDQPTKATIVEAPRVVKTKFTEQQPVVVVKLGIETFVWWANWTSFNALIDKFGEDENKMINKEIDLVLVRQPVNGKMKKVIYLEGSFQEEDED